MKSSQVSLLLLAVIVLPLLFQNCSKGAVNATVSSPGGAISTQGTEGGDPYTGIGIIDVPISANEGMSSEFVGEELCDDFTFAYKIRINSESIISQTRANCTDVEILLDPINLRFFRVEPVQYLDYEGRTYIQNSGEAL